MSSIMRTAMSLADATVLCGEKRWAAQSKGQPVTREQILGRVCGHNLKDNMLWKVCVHAIRGIRATKGIRETAMPSGINTMTFAGRQKSVRHLDARVPGQPATCRAVDAGSRNKNGTHSRSMF